MIKDKEFVRSTGKNQLAMLRCFVGLMRQWRIPCTPDSVQKTWNRSPSLPTVPVTPTRPQSAPTAPSYRTVPQPSKPSEAKRGVYYHNLSNLDINSTILILCSS